MTEHEGYRIVGDGTFGMYYIKTSVGAVPKVLSGSFTKPDFAKEAISRYVSKKEAEAAKEPPVKKVKLTPREG